MALASRLHIVAVLAIDHGIEANCVYDECIAWILLARAGGSIDFNYGHDVHVSHAQAPGSMCAFDFSQALVSP